MQTGTLEAGIPARKFNDMAQLPHSHGTAIRTDIILSTAGEQGVRRGPQAFLVEQSEGSLAGAHYHVEAQFLDEQQHRNPHLLYRRPVIQLAGIGFRVCHQFLERVP